MQQHQQESTFPLSSSNQFPCYTEYIYNIYILEMEKGTESVMGEICEFKYV